MQKTQSVHLIIADLPYGVQHAPRQGQRIESFQPMLEKALPGWYDILMPGGAIALSFNTYTLKKADLAVHMKKAGFSICDSPPYDDFDHWVEQAVQRDLIVAVKE
jgi:tRNA G10  N-methylase Trm11